MDIKDVKKNPKHMTSIGGQALIEGIMMRGPEKIAVSIRKPNGEIELTEEKVKTLGDKYPFFKLPFIRGVIALVESLFLGTRMLMYSAEFIEEEEEIEEDILDKLFGDNAEDVGIGITVIISILMSVGLFMLLPTMITSIFRRVIENPITLNLIEGFIRICIFMIYIISISRLDDIKRVFEYHGAEHKAIHCYEGEKELTVENVKKYPILHARCGTSFLFMVMIVSILVLSLFGWPNPLQRFINRIIMFPVIAGISYEINRLIGKSSSKLAYALSYPGLMIQKFATVKEPDESQMEIAIVALKKVIPENKDDDKWT